MSIQNTLCPNLSSSSCLPGRSTARRNCSAKGVMKELKKNLSMRYAKNFRGVEGGSRAHLAHVQIHFHWIFGGLPDTCLLALFTPFYRTYYAYSRVPFVVLTWLQTQIMLKLIACILKVFLFFFLSSKRAILQPLPECKHYQGYGDERDFREKTGRHGRTGLRTGLYSGHRNGSEGDMQKGYIRAWKMGKCGRMRLLWARQYGPATFLVGQIALQS